MSAKSLRLAFIGGGVNSAVGSTHFIASQMDGLFKVACGSFSRNADINVATAERWGIAPGRVYSDWRVLLKEEKKDLDAVVILTPTPNHPEQVLTALTEGYSVICEKALATSTQDAEEIHAVVCRDDSFLAVTYNYTGYPMLRELRRLIRQGRLGRIEQLQVEMPQEGFARTDKEGKPVIPQQWRLKDSKIPTISLDLGVHLHHIVDFLTAAKPVRVVANQASFGAYREVVDSVNAIVEYSDGIICNLWYSKAALGCRNGLRIRIFGDQGSAEWFQMDPEHLLVSDGHGHTNRVDRASIDVQEAQLARYNRFKAGHPSGFLEAFANIYADIGAALTQRKMEGEQTIYSSQHALEGLYLLEAIAKSSMDGSWVNISPVRLRNEL